MGVERGDRRRKINKIWIKVVLVEGSGRHISDTAGGMGCLGWGGERGDVSNNSRGGKSGGLNRDNIYCTQYSGNAICSDA